MHWLILLLALSQWTRATYSTRQEEVWETRDACLDAQHRYLYDELFILMHDLDEIRLLQQTGLVELSTQLGQNGISWCDAFAASVHAMHRRLKLQIYNIKSDARAYNKAITNGWFRTLSLLQDQSKNKGKCEQYDSRAQRRHTGLLGEMRRCMETHVTQGKQQFMIEKFAD